GGAYFDAAPLTAVEVLREVSVQTSEVRGRQGCWRVRPSVDGFPGRPSRIRWGRCRKGSDGFLAYFSAPCKRRTTVPGGRVGQGRGAGTPSYAGAGRKVLPNGRINPATVPSPGGAGSSRFRVRNLNGFSSAVQYPAPAAPTTITGGRSVMSRVLLVEDER